MIIIIKERTTVIFLFKHNAYFDSYNGLLLPLRQLCYFNLCVFITLPEIFSGCMILIFVLNCFSIYYNIFLVWI